MDIFESMQDTLVLTEYVFIVLSLTQDVHVVLESTMMLFNDDHDDGDVHDDDDVHDDGDVHDDDHGDGHDDDHGGDHDGDRDHDDDDVHDGDDVHGDDDELLLQELDFLIHLKSKA
ncbi:hypothetical protein TNCT_257621 [Trichonephila clavata]|uniref:Uncharacterized protein n=1 Tax=Trichonephila clavata TaxID=2740835 RepID=A0A8X6KIA0_TRICU|nr:hypothetical protein TNCT_257621 [Trichonephila clavata]